MSEPANRRDDTSRASSVGLLLFALAWGSLMMLILAPKDLFFSDTSGFSVESAAIPVVNQPGR